MAQQRDRGTPITLADLIVASTASPLAEVFSATDPFGVRVYMRAHTLEDHDHHGETTDFEGHRDCVESPAVIAPHADTPEKRIYLGKPWSRDDSNLVPIQRKLVTKFDAQTTTARIISAHNVSVTTAETGLGTPVYRDKSPEKNK